METWNIGDRVKVAGGDELGRIYAIEHDWAAIALDKDAHKNNAPVFWAKFEELERV